MLDFLKKKEAIDTIYVSYDDHRDNFGDILNPIIAAYLSDKNIKKISKKASKKVEHYYMIGSILQRCNKNSVIWGSGLISKDVTCTEIPKKVVAVRGPLTRKKLIEQQIECPEVYGDPAILLPGFYYPKDIKKKFEIGIIPHYKDKKNKHLKKVFAADSRVKIINIQNKKPLKVVDQILACKNIISSSLHGIIVADAYRIPSLWVEFSDKVFGQGFKFRDYFASVGRETQEPVNFQSINSFEEAISLMNNSSYNVNINPEKLIASFPG